MASTIDQAKASKKFQEVGLSKEKADIFVSSLTKNEDGTYNTADVEQLKETMAEVKSALDELFKKHDKDNAGFLTFEQAVKAGMERCPNMSENSVKEMVTHFDKDKNDKIDMNEFSEFFISLAILREVLLACFNEMDTDKNGTLEEEELEKILTEKLCLFPGQGKALMKLFDQDGDNKISKEEFLQRDQFVTLWARLFDEK